jgi:methionyl-tRNA formyltransferase
MSGQGIGCHTYDNLDEAWPELLKWLPPQDLLISVYNHDRLGGDFLAHFRHAINFHDAPLPRYAGLNAVSWALLAGETEHGVTWHTVSPAFDAGDIVLQETFRIEPEWIALNLAMKSVDVGCHLLTRILDQLVQDSFSSFKQDLSQRTYFGRKLVPYGGRFPFLASLECIDRLRRATSYFPMPNSFCAPAVIVGNTTMKLIQFTMRPREVDEPPGTCLSNGPSGAVFSIVGGTIAAELVQLTSTRPIRTTDPGIHEVLHPGVQAEVDSSSYDALGLPIREPVSALHSF